MKNIQLRIRIKKKTKNKKIFKKQILKKNNKYGFRCLFIDNQYRNIESRLGDLVVLKRVESNCGEVIKGLT